MSPLEPMSHGTMTRVFFTFNAVQNGLLNSFRAKMFGWVIPIRTSAVAGAAIAASKPAVSAAIRKQAD